MYIKNIIQLWFNNLLVLQLIGECWILARKYSFYQDTKNTWMIFNVKGGWEGILRDFILRIQVVVTFALSIDQSK